MVDEVINNLIEKEIDRQKKSLNLIPSENSASKDVLDALGTVLNNKYSEGYPKKRYYGGNEFIDEIEEIAIERAKKLFGVEHVNVQCYSGSPANLAVYIALCKPGDVIMGQNLPDGGHLTHGWKASVTGQLFKSVPYHVKGNGFLDMEEIETLAKQNKPKLMWVGATSYVREFPFKELGKIADSVGAYLAADISHIAGLVAAGVHKSPTKFAHIITTTTHKTLRGPRGAMIMVTKKGLDKDPDLSTKIDRAVFPCLQGGPHDNQTAAIAIALQEAAKPEFKIYAERVVKNAKTLAENLINSGLDLVSNGTDNHMMVIDLRKKNITGKMAEKYLSNSKIIVNKNMIPSDPRTPFDPSGIRLGTPLITTRGMKEKDMGYISSLIVNVIENINNEDVINRVRGDVEQLVGSFPMFKW